MAGNTESPRSVLPHVVILGGGFAGLSVAKALAHAPVRLTLIDRENHHLFAPLLYQTATAGLSVVDIAVALRRIFSRQRNASVLFGEVTSIDVEARQVLLADTAPVQYDYLVVATGAVTSYFGHDDWAAHAPGMKTIQDALEVRQRVLLAFEQAERTSDPAEQAVWQTFVVVGAGPTGVELAGSLAEMARHTLKHDFRRIDPSASRIVLLEGGDRVLPTFPPDLSAEAMRALSRLGVDVRTQSKVTAIDERGVVLGDTRIHAGTVIWAAGITASPVGKSLGAPIERGGRVRVNEELTIPNHPEVFVAGDLAHFEQDGQVVPGVAPAAMQGGRYIAKAILKRIKGEPCSPFRYDDRGSIATIGRGSAVADLKGRHISGLVAWWVWIAIHVIYLIGFRNRFLVLSSWTWAYWTYARNARVTMVGRWKPRRLLPPPNHA